MKAIRIILFFSLLLTSQITFGQGFSYTFEDPCTFKSKTIYINNPSGNVFLTYNGQVKSFTAQQLQSGAVESWVNDVKSQNVSGPCSGVALAQNTQISQYVAQNAVMVMAMVMGQLGSMDFNSGVSMVDLTGIASNANATSNSEKNDEEKDNKNQVKPSSNVEKQEMFQGQMMNVSTASNGTVIHFTQTEKGEVYLAPTKISPHSLSSSSLANSNNNQNGTNNSNSGGSTTDNGNQTNGQSTSSNGVNQQTGGNSNQTGGTTTSTDGTTQNGNQTTVQPINGGNNTTTSENITNNTQGSTNNFTNNNSNNQNSTTQNNNGWTTNQETTETKKDLGVGSSSDLRTNGSVKQKVANAQKGGIIVTGDIVGIRSVKVVGPDQVKVNLSFTKANTTNTRITGSMINFTTGVKNSSFTFYKGYRYKSLTTIISNTSMINFEWDKFNTMSVMECYKYKSWTGTLGVNYTLGKIGKSGFNSFTAMSGVMTNFTIKKNWSFTPMVVMVYSPYIYYYEGLWYKSGFLALPFLSCDYRVSKKFKFNISFSGVQQINDNTLNYQILLGGKTYL